MKKNAINAYKHYCELVENPTGNDTQERAIVQKLALKAKIDMEKHFRTSNKYKNDSEIQALLGEKKDGKSKG